MNNPDSDITSPETFADAQAQLLGQLRAMEASGDTGFEGFVRDCLQESLGIRFRLMKSGPQSGADMRGDAPANHLQVAVEGKRYGNTTPLPVEQLQLKIVSASQAGSILDLWVLATTRTISATDRIKLAETGERQGVATAIIDASDGPGLPSALDLLSANSPDAVGKHLPSSPEIAAWLRVLRLEPDFALRLDRVLEPFRRNDVGYAAAREAAAAWLVTAMSDEATARARLDSFAGLGTGDAIVIPRLAVEAELDSWFGKGPTVPLAILGDEGVGKTWSLLNWWRRRMREASDELPLTLIVPASAVTGSGDIAGPDLVARLLADRLPIRDQQFWRRRLALWAQEHTSAPRVLLVIDGLNQQPEFTGWQKTLQPFFDKDWNGLFAAAVTCRTAWWEDDLKALAALVPRAQTITVPVFDESELDQMLARFNLHRGAFGADMHEILAIPRYCQLAIKRREELAGSGDITIERLIYEDWRHRIARVGSGLAPSEDEFRAFITEQGTQLRSALDNGTPSLSRREMVEALDRDMGRGEPALRMALSEIVDGNWMQRAQDGSRRFRLNAKYVPFALGLALHQELRTVGQIAASNHLGTFMDPLRGTDRGTAILRNAVTIALLDPASPEWLFNLLIDSWFGQQNFGVVDATTLGQLAPAAPARFLDFAERLWSGERHHIRDDTLLIDAIVSAAGTETFRMALRDALTLWLGRVEVHPGRLPRAKRADSEALKSLSDTYEAGAAHWAGARDRVATIDGIMQVEATRYTGEGDQERLTTYAAGVLSFLPRAEFVPCYVAWALARAIEGRSDTAIEWTLRVNLIDPELGCAAILGVATLLANEEPQIVRATGIRLLEALATPAAGAAAATLGVESFSPRPLRGLAVGAGGAVALAHSDNMPELDDFSLLREHALLPGSVLAPSDISKLRAAADGFDACDYLAGGHSRTGADVTVEQAEAVLARWAPDALASLIRRAYRSIAQRMTPNEDADRDKTETLILGLISALSNYWPVLGADEMAALQPIVGSFLSRGFEQGDRAGNWLHLQVPRLFGHTAGEQIEMLAADPFGPCFFENDNEVLNDPEASDYARLAELIAGDKGEYWLGYLLNVDRKAMPDDFDALYSQVGSENLLARKYALQLFRFTPSDARYRWLVESGWSWHDKMDRDEGASGSLVLFHASFRVAVPGIEKRVDPEILGALLAEHPEDHAALERFTEYLVDSIRGRRFPGTALGRHHWLDQRDAVRITVARRADRLVTALDELIADDPENAFGFDSFPTIDVITELCRSAPEHGARLWDELWESYQASNWTLSSFEQAPFAGDAERLQPLQMRVVNTARTDADIETLVSGTLGNGRETWLTDRLDDLLIGASAGEIAKGLMIARFLDPSPNADTIWRRIDAMPLSNWLAELRVTARREYDLGRTAASAARSFLESTDQDQALAALILIKHAADYRAFRAFKRAVEDQYADLPHHTRAFWAEWEETLKAAAKKNSVGRDKRYLLAEAPKVTHHPWRS